MARPRSSFAHWSRAPSGRSAACRPERCTPTGRTGWPGTVPASSWLFPGPLRGLAQTSTSPFRNTRTHTRPRAQVGCTSTPAGCPNPSTSSTRRSMAVRFRRSTTRLDLERTLHRHAWCSCTADLRVSIGRRSSRWSSISRLLDSRCWRPTFAAAVATGGLTCASTTCANAWTRCVIWPTRRTGCAIVAGLIRRALRCTAAATAGSWSWPR